MNSLSLSPRFEGFRIVLPKELIPEEIYEKWYKVVNANDKNFFREPIDIVNESINGIELTGISDATVEQEQMGSKNVLTGRMEPRRKAVYRTTGNIIDLLNNELTITFRHTQGFYTYFLLFESFFWHHAKDTLSEFTDHLYIEILGEEGEVMSHLILKNPIFASIDSLSLSYNRIERSNETFNCVFKYNDIDFELGPISAQE